VHYTLRYVVVPSGKPRWTTARRIVLAFGAVLLIFALALVVVVVGLAQIGDAEQQVVRLDHSKHAGHHAAAMARAQYIHQAHTLLEWNDSHMSHYQDIATEARMATEHLRHQVAGDAAIRQAEQIAALVAESDRRFREEVLPAIAAGERSRIGELHEMTEHPVEEVVALNEQLNRALEAQAETAQQRAATLRERVQLVVFACFGLAIVLALAVGAYLLRSISRPVAALRSGAARIGSGDLTARVGLDGDDELAELARAFDRMAEDLSLRQAELLEAHRLASIGQVASGVAHEINNPLGVMLGYLTLLRREAPLADREELRIIEDEARQCQTIVAGLLDLARPIRLHRSDVELGDLVRDAASRLEEAGRLDGVAIRFADSAAVHLSADEGKLRQIVINLLGNAIEAAREPAASRREVNVSWATDDGRARLDVRDGGPGISPEARARLFEPFFTTKSRGHGLGLAIARTLARAHGGDIELDGRSDGAGAHARLSIPLHDPTA
jgi:two-component system, NtrC family, sensor kinase